MRRGRAIWMVGMLALGVAIGSVGCGGSASSITSSGDGGTGMVTVAITDDPSDDLLTFTMDIDGITLQGAAGTGDVTVFPTSGGPVGPVTVDLLSNQGLNTLLANAAVPAGTYHGLEITYDNPQATTADGPQTVQHPRNEIVGGFAPPLVVEAGSTQAVQIDIDLTRSVIALGPTELLLTPVIFLQVLDSDAPIRAGQSAT